MVKIETYTPETLDEVAALLLAAESGARPLARGARLVAACRGGPGPVVVELTRVPELNRLDYEERDGLLIGAALPLGGAMEFPPISDAYGILADGARLAGAGEAWAQATLAELLGSAQPAPELLLPLICLGGSVAIFGPHGWSEMGVEALYAGGGGVRLQPSEFIVALRLPAPSPRSGGAYLRSTAQAERGGAISIGALLLMQEDLSTCCGARVAMCLAPRPPLRALDAERALRGRYLDERAVSQAGEQVAEALEDSPGDPERVAEHREALRALACQAIQAALDRARGQLRF